MEKIRAIRFLTFPYDSPVTHFQWTRVRLGTIQTGFHTQSSRSSLSPAFLWNKIGLIICILTLWWHKRWWERVHKAKHKKDSLNMCAKATIYCIFGVCLSIRVWFVCFLNTFVCKHDRLHAFVQFHSSVWLYKANTDQLLLHSKPPLCPLYCTKSSLQLTLHTYTNTVNTQNALGLMQRADRTWVKVIHLCAC